MSAVINLLIRKPLTLCAMDEFGGFLKRISNNCSSAHERVITKTLRSAWGKSFKPLTTPEWARRLSEEIWAPALSIYGILTAGDFFSSLRGEDVVNGFLNRFLLLKTDTTTRDSSLIHLWFPTISGNGWPSFMLNPILAGQTILGQYEGPPAYVMPWGAGAEAVYERMKDDITTIHKDTTLEPFFARTAEMAVRIATIASVEDGCVTREAMIWGRDLAMWSGRSMVKAAGEHMAEYEREGTSRRIFRFVKGRPKPASRGDIRKHIGQALDSRTMTDILETLVESGDAIAHPQVASAKGGPKPKYPKYSAAKPCVLVQPKVDL